MKCQSYRFFRGSDFLRIEAISHNHSKDPATNTYIDNTLWNF